MNQTAGRKWHFFVLIALFLMALTACGGGEGGGGGDEGGGGKGGPAHDTWRTTSTGVPSARRWHTVVWSGSEMIVWGGFTGVSYFNTGGRYTP